MKQAETLIKQSTISEAIGVAILCVALLVALSSPWMISRDHLSNTPPAEYLTQNNSVYATLGGRGPQ